jgi:methylmalonyl-CoA carboxyltransferase small subunit
VSGNVVRLAAQVGQSLQAGDILVVLEAMKMETNITAPAAGKIAAVRVAQGDAVQAGQIVVEFE